MMKKLIFKTLLLFIIGLTSLSSHENIKDVTLQLSWFSQFQFAGYYIAKEKGFYKDENIELTIKPYESHINVAREISEQKAHFGIGKETLILEKIQHFNNLVAIYPLFQVSPLALITKKDTNISNIEDFKNKRLMATINDANQVALKAMLYSNGIDFKNIQFLKHTHDINDLLLNKTDIISAYVSKAPYRLKKQNIPYNIFSPKDYGFDMYSDFLFTNQELINHDSSLVKAFKRASLKGWQYAYNNIEESVDLIIKKYNTQNLTKAELLFEAKELKKLSYIQGSSLGEMNKNKVIRIFDLYRLINSVTQLAHQDFDSFIYQENRIEFTQKEKDFLKEEHHLTMCIVENNMPYEKMENNNFQGIVSQYKKLLEEKINIKITTFVTNNKEESNKYLVKQYCDITPIKNNVKNKKKFHLSESYLELPYIVFSKKDHVFISNLTQFENTRIITNQAEDLNTIIDKNYPLINKIETNTFQEAINKLKSDKVDFFVTNIANAAYLIKDYYAPDIHISGRLSKKQTFHFAVLPENKILLNILNKSINSIQKEEHEKIANNFTSFQYKHIADYSFALKVTIFLSIVIIFLIYVYRSEKKLKTKISKLNYNLKDTIKQEVQKNRQKDEYLFRQSKLASMGEMIANIAHQWRQPLNRISLSSQVIENLIKEGKLSKPDLIEKKISHITENVQYMSDTIEDFMYYFNPKKEKKVFYFYETFQKTIELLTTRTKNVNISLSINPKLAINSYENEFKQIILVILNNALDNYELKKTKYLKIDIMVRENKDHFSINIIDNGGGINKDIINKIFEPYFTTKFKKEGSGIGLYMVKMIIEQSMHGTIDVTSIDNVTNFLIELKKV